MKTRLAASALIILLVGLIVLRLMLPFLVLRYVNRTLGRIPDYQANVRAIDINLWRGAYVIHDLVMVKKDGAKLLPFFDAEKIDLAIEWPALMQGKVVGKIRLIHPTINLIQSSSQDQSQLTASQSWIDQGKKLFPLEINRLVIEDGSVTFRELAVNQASDLHLRDLNAELTGITNVESKGNPLPSHLQATATVFDTGHLSIDGAAELMTDLVSFNVNVSLENVDLTSLNAYVKHHAGFTFKSGTFALYASLRAHNAGLQGYLKPIFNHIAIVDIKDASNPVEFAWEAVAATIVEIFTNHAKESFATVIPLSGNIDNPKASLFSTLANIVRNAFIQAFRPGIDRISNS